MHHVRASVLALALAPLACFEAGNDDGVAEETTAGETTGDTGDGSDAATSTTDGTSTDTGTAETSATETSAEPYCGNGVIEDGETCDAQDVGQMTCASFGHSAGAITCNVDCTLDVGNCHTCGDTQLDGLEACDGQNLASLTCTDLGFMDGALGCSGDCLVFDTSGCVPYANCGNGQLDPMAGEECEGMMLDGQTCVGLGYTGGPLACTPGCLFDTSGCAVCGNGVREDGEECDEFDFGSDNCTDYGFMQGFLNCTPACTVETFDCCNGPGCMQW